VALVTGGGSGIGRATALAFAREGAQVVVADRMQETARETVVQIEAGGGTAMAVAVDVSRSDEVEQMVDATVAAHGRLDFAVNNAGLAEERIPLVDMSEETWDRTLAINLKGVWLCMKYEIPVMLAQGGGAIVNVASVVGLVGSGRQCAYVASKHGVVGLTRAAAIEYAR